MPRKAHPWFRRSDGWWYVKINGKPEKLARGRQNKETAIARWHELMAERAMNRPSESLDHTVVSVIDLYLNRPTEVSPRDPYRAKPRGESRVSISLKQYAKTT